MTGSALSGIFVFALVVSTTAPGSVLGQKAPDIDRNPPPSAPVVSPLPEAPAERFAACKDIEDRARREACIERQTSRGNPATKSVPGPQSGGDGLPGATSPKK
tara:strand:- start:931 stop:1239 length:309 start_codon:yes stop_codon:yes gene_type:complete